MLNSMAFTFISQVLSTRVQVASIRQHHVTRFGIPSKSDEPHYLAQVSQAFNKPLLTYYKAKRIEGLGEEYGDEPIFYLVAEYSASNACDGSW